MPDQLNKQSIINLLIDSPLREPIKINLIDIVNNTAEPDLPKIFSTITKELEIFQKATERRMKLAEETIAKLGGVTPQPQSPAATAPVAEPSTTTPPVAPTLDLPPLPPAPPLEPVMPPAETPAMESTPLSVPPLDLPPLPQMPSTPTVEPTMPPLPPTPPAPATASTPAAPSPIMQGDEAALAEIQKELESLKSSVAADAAPTPATAA